MKLQDLAPAPGAKKSRKRVGRGTGSSLGKTAGRGTKGQNSRSGGGTPPWFEGGQMPLQRRVPKRGFTNIFKKQYAILNIRDLAAFQVQTQIDPKILMEVGLLKKTHAGIKLLGNGEIDRALTITVHKASASAVQKIEAAGGKVEFIS